MGQIKIERISIGAGSRTAIYDAKTCKDPLYAQHIGPKEFEVTLTDGNFYHAGDPALEGQFEMDTAVGVYTGFVQKQIPGIGVPESFTLTLIAD